MTTIYPRQKAAGDVLYFFHHDDPASYYDVIHEMYHLKAKIDFRIIYHKTLVLMNAKWNSIYIFIYMYIYIGSYFSLMQSKFT